MRGRRFGCSLLIVPALVLASACGDDGGTSVSPAAVQIVDNAFSPGTLRVKAGTTVSWTWVGENTHSVVGTFDGQDYNSGDHTRADGVTATHQFASAGTYEYVCGFHGGSMRGTVIVE
ncbi:MAG: plastocyanin/azurin family copper-binding protein [Acidimicrobiales bacterium]